MKHEELAMRIYKLGQITKLEHTRRQTGTDTSEWWVKMTNQGGKQVTLISDNYNKYMEHNANWNGLCRLEPRFADPCTEFLRMAKVDAKEYQEYLRLKEKFG